MADKIGMVDPTIFEFLQSKIDEEQAFADVSSRLGDSCNLEWLLNAELEAEGYQAGA
jgi:hypothetical protein